MKRTKLNGSRQAVVATPPAQPVKNYGQLVEQLKKLSPDWQVSRVGVEADTFRNRAELMDYSRNLWRENPYIIGYGQDLCAQVIGPTGYTVRMTIKEEEDRIIHTPQERDMLRSLQARRDELARHIAKANGTKIKARKAFREVKGVAKVEVGEPDTFANQMIERHFREWCLPENCTVTGRLSYNESRQLRIKSCARDGEHFIRLVRDAKYKYGFKIQHINAEWCSYYFSGIYKPTGNPVRFGIEYDDSGPAPMPVAYHFLKAPANSWAGFAPQNVLRSSPENCIRIEARDIIHYAKFDDDADVTRPVPWTTPVMSNARQLAKAMEAAVVAMRVGACSNVFFETDLIGPDGTTAAGADPEIMRGLAMQMNPGGMHGLPPGVRAKEFNPNNPNPHTGGFRNEMLREMCVGLPAAQFSTIGQNYAEINFSAGRLERLSITAQWQMLQEWDITHAERPIFREWLAMALTTGAVPLPIAKFNKFHSVRFTGKRWVGVDPIKESNAKALDLANKFTSLQRIHDEQNTDLEDTLREIAEANMLMETYGISTATTQGPMVAEDPEEEDEDEDEDEEDEDKQKPKPKAK